MCGAGISDAVRLVNILAVTLTSCAILLAADVPLRGGISLYTAQYLAA
jgi:hypothetical protein